MQDDVSNDLPTLEDAFSPVDAAARELPRTAEERRLGERVDLAGHARYRFPTIPAASTWTQGLVVNLSDTGGCFLVDGGWSLIERLEVEEWVPLDVELHPDGDEPLRIRAEIMWVQPDGGGEGGLDRVGARFDAIAPEERDRLRLLIDTVGSNG